jgi:hypothetical protein
MPGDSETFSEKVRLAIVEKLLLGGVIAVLGGLIAFYVDVLQTPWSFQEKIFEKRFNAYAEIAQRSDDVLQALNSYYYDPLSYATLDEINKSGNLDQDHPRLNYFRFAKARETKERYEKIFSELLALETGSREAAPVGGTSFATADLSLGLWGLVGTWDLGLNTYLIA